MRYRLILAAALLASGTAFAGEHALRFGLIDTRSSPLACATFQGPKFQAGQGLYFVAFDPPRWVPGAVVHERSAACKEEALLEGTAYDVQLEQADTVQSELGIAAVAPGAMPVIAGEQVLLSGPGHGIPVVFRRCTSSEGIHFVASRGSMRLWHAYYHLGYDVEPTCSEDEPDKSLGRPGG